MKHAFCAIFIFQTRSRTVQEIMGHANYNTTVSYTHVLDDIKSKEAEKVGEFLQNKNDDAKIEYSGLLGIM